MNFRICPALGIAVCVVTGVLGSAQSFGQYAATPTTLVAFNGSNGANPAAGLVADAAGNLWGTTLYGGPDNDGTVFAIAKTSTGYASTPTLSFRFTGTNGANPTAGLTMDSVGNLFGTTYNGGGYINEFGDNENFGTVFELVKNAAGSYTLSTLVSFEPSPNYVNLGEGAKPWGGLVLDATGDLYGTTTISYSYAGTVFEVEKTSAGYQLITWWNFPGYDGETPQGTLIISAGKLFGTTNVGTTTGDGGVFAIASPGGLTPLNSTNCGANLPVTCFDGTDGANPVAGVIADAAGNLFGTTYNGGAGSYGTVFEIAKTSAGYASPIALHSFVKTDGANPRAGLMEDAAGNLFGTTENGGQYGYGTVFELVKNAAGSYTFTPLLSFNGTDGAYPFGGLIAGRRGGPLRHDVRRRRSG